MSITPLPSTSDSRTFKQASSVCTYWLSIDRFEGAPSDLNAQDTLFQLVSITNAYPVAKKLKKEDINNAAKL